MWDVFFKEMEKNATMIGTTLFGALAAHSAVGKTKELKKRTQLSPPTQSGQVGLTTPYKNQFDGANRTGADGVRSPLMSLYD